MKTKDKRQDKRTEKANKPVSLLEICTAFSISLLVAFFTLNAGNKQCISYDPNEFIGKWNAINTSGDFQSLTFNRDSTAVLVSGTDSVLRFNYNIINNNLQLVDISGKVSNTGIIRLVNDTLSLLDLYGNGKLTSYKKLSDSQKQLTGIQQPGDKLIINVYPNPFNSTFTLELPNKAIEDFTINITDMSGKVLINKQLVSANLVTVDGSNWAQGVYLVKVTGANNETNHTKLIKVTY